MIGAWDLPMLAEVLLPAAVPLPLIAVLYLDRALAPRVSWIFSTLVFPVAYVTMDYALGFTPLGTLFSTASRRFRFSTITQLVSITGIWGVSFLIAWFAAMVNAAWESRFDLSAVREPVALFMAAAGARIVFWAEGDGVVPQAELPRFMTRAGAFAREHGVYFAPAILELRYGSSLNHNRVLMFSPDGRLAFSYQKSKSWLPVQADGVIRTIDTPYGTVAAAICFDLDFPGFLVQAARAGTDIRLVPG
jgi:apolipoprotein N-acyltransferase